MADFSSVFGSIPPVTRTILFGTGIVTVPCLLGIVSPASVALMWWRLQKGWEVWRPFTAFFFGGSGFPLLYDVFLIYRNSSALERDFYMNQTADYAWTHLMLGVFILALNVPFAFPFLFRPLLHAQNYLWCRANPTLKVSIFGLLTIPTSLYPPALIVLDVLTGGPAKAIGGLIGLLAGHLWWFLATYLPAYAPAHLRRSNPLATPRRFRSLFPLPRNRIATNTTWGGARIDNRDRVQATGTSSATRISASDAVRHRWGSGQRLGGEPL